MSLRAVVFDCDGTIADTESLANRAWSATLADHDYEATDDDFRAVIGHPFAQTWAHFSSRAELGDRDAFRSRLRGRFLTLLDTELETHPDAVRTIRQLVAEGVAIAVASSSSHAHVERVLEHAGIREAVEAIIGADDVARHKPAPDPYLEAARRLGVAPSEATAVEDTAVGVASASCAGLYTVGVLRAHTRPEDLAGADRIVAEISPEVLVPSADDPAERP